MISRSDILSRFEAWLDSAMTEEAPPQGIPAEILIGSENGAGSEPTDFYSIWASLTALTQEVKLQGRAFKQMSESLTREAEQRSRKQVLDALLEVREQMLRGLKGTSVHQEARPSFWDRIFSAHRRRIQHSLEVVNALLEGYRLGLARLDELLTQFHVQPIECEGDFFDPQRMNAVDVEETSETEDGIVIAVYRTGYELNGEVYRPAQVRVARTPRNEASHE